MNGTPTHFEQVFAQTRVLLTRIVRVVHLMTTVVGVVTAVNVCWEFLRVLWLQSVAIGSTQTI
jgi:hypothetical protein